MVFPRHLYRPGNIRLAGPRCTSIVRYMATHWTLGADVADPGRLAASWELALGYVDEGYDDPDGESIVDPDGRGPAISLPRVPEPKTANNRVQHRHQGGGRRAMGHGQA